MLMIKGIIPHPGSLCHFFARSVFAMFALACLSAALLFIGCNTDPDPEPTSVNGEWVAFWGDSRGDSFNINTNEASLAYDDGGWGFGYKGVIQEIIRFDSIGKSGVVLIKYKEPKPTDWDWTDLENPKPITISGDYIGVYFKDLTNTSAQIANPVDHVTYLTPAKVTLTEAKATFTADKMQDFVSQWATYQKQ